MKNKKWHHATTRIMGLFEIQLANEVYPKFPIRRSEFNLDTVVIGENGILKRYVDEDQLSKFEKIARTKDHLKLFKGFEDYEKGIKPELKKILKEPMKNREDFMRIFRQLWVHEITGFFVGLYSEDKKLLKIISNLRGTKSAQHIAISDVLPKLFNEISIALSIDAELLKYAMPDEIISLKLNADVLALRRKQYVLELINGKLRLLVGDNAKKFINKFYKNVKDDIDENIEEFSGNTAHPGKARGRVTVVTHDNDLVNVKKGDILVSPMTRTSFLPAMERAAAFITDEGGITCHAAITARELKKPCVVGTKIASRVLKNGYEVYVDADKGKIKILKK